MYITRRMTIIVEKVPDELRGMGWVQGLEVSGYAAYYAYEVLLHHASVQEVESHELARKEPFDHLYIIEAYGWKFLYRQALSYDRSELFILYT